MTKDEIGTLIALTAANFPNTQERDLRPTLNLWKEMLSDMPFDVAKAAVIKVLSTARFWPTVAEIREAATHLTQPHIMSSAEAWGLFERSNDRYGYYRPEEGMNMLNPLIRQTVRSMGGYRELCSSENVGVTRGQFMKIYEQLAAREKEMAVLPASVRELIDGTVKLLPQ